MPECYNFGIIGFYPCKTQITDLIDKIENVTSRILPIRPAEYFYLNIIRSLEILLGNSIIEFFF